VGLKAAILELANEIETDSQIRLAHNIPAREYVQSISKQLKLLVKAAGNEQVIPPVSPGMQSLLNLQQETHARAVAQDEKRKAQAMEGLDGMVKPVMAVGGPVDGDYIPCPEGMFAHVSEGVKVPLGGAVYVLKGQLNATNDLYYVLEYSEEETEKAKKAMSTMAKPLIIK
jgi:hypothetical protein